MIRPHAITTLGYLNGESALSPLSMSVLGYLILGVGGPPHGPPGGGIGGRHREPANRIRTRRPTPTEKTLDKDLLFWVLAAIATIEDEEGR